MSAQLDGEPLGVSAAALDDHLTSCAECASWAREATRVTRLLRLDVRPVPDLSDRITADVVLPVRRVLRRRLLLRVLLVLAGIAQLVIGVSAIAGDEMGMAMAAHAAHEAAAWNLALGAAFAGAAIVPRRAAGLIPLLTTFIVVLGALSVHDSLDGAVTAARLSTHIAAVVGLLLVVLLDRAERALPSTAVPQAGESGEDATTFRTVA